MTKRTRVHYTDERMRKTACGKGKDLMITANPKRVTCAKCAKWMISWVGTRARPRPKP